MLDTLEWSYFIMRFRQYIDVKIINQKNKQTNMQIMSVLLFFFFLNLI